MPQGECSTAIFRVLRRARDEAQLTQVLAAVAGADEDVGGALARAFVDVTSEAHATEREALGEVPKLLRCRPEAALRSPSGDNHGRVDLRFDDQAREFTLLAELKLHSGYGDRQVERYQDALADLPTGRRAALVAVTRNVPGTGEPEPGTPQWLGSVRWTDIYERLWELPIKSDELRSQWRSLLRDTAQGDYEVPVSVPTGRPSPAQSTSATDVPKAIPDANTTGVSSTVTLGGSGTVSNVDVSIPRITHTWDGDLQIELIGPDGTRVALANRPGGPGNSGDNFVDTVFSDSASTPLSAGTAPYSGTFKPQDGRLASFNGKPVAGKWTLRVADMGLQDTGTLSAWGMRTQTTICN